MREKLALYVVQNSNDTPREMDDRKLESGRRSTDP
jgi:hypothetical protein